jgi:hypothetical protein
MSYFEKKKLSDAAGNDGISVLHDMLELILLELQKLNKMMSAVTQIELDNSDIQGENDDY